MVRRVLVFFLHWPVVVLTVTKVKGGALPPLLQAHLTPPVAVWLALGRSGPELLPQIGRASP
jgi:hypothetical protein